MTVPVTIKHEKGSQIIFFSNYLAPSSRKAMSQQPCVVIPI